MNSETRIVPAELHGQRIDQVLTKLFPSWSRSQLSDWIKRLTIAGEPVPDFDHKTEYHNHLEEKYK